MGVGGRSTEVTGITCSPYNTQWSFNHRTIVGSGYCSVSEKEEVRHN